MPECQYCGNHVTKRYMRVFAPEDIEADGEVRACPECTTVREGADVRQARSRNSGQVGEVQ